MIQSIGEVARSAESDSRFIIQKVGDLKISSEQISVATSLGNPDLEKEIIETLKKEGELNLPHISSPFGTQ